MMLGGVESITRIIWTQLVLLSQASVAVQVRVMTFVWPQPFVTRSVYLTATEPQPSWAVAVPVTFVPVSAPHSRVALAGQVSLGGTVSLMRIVNDQVLLLPQASCASQVRVITHG